MDIKTLGSSSKGNCYIVDNFMIECGLPIAKIVKGVEKLPVFCLVSHVHADHAKSCRELEQLGVAIICNKDVAKKYELTQPYIIKEQVETFKICNYNVTAISLPHDAINYGFIVSNANDSLFYASDMGYLPYNFYGNFTEILLESNFCEDILRESSTDIAAKQRISRDHFSIQQAIIFLKNLDLSKTNKIRLIHLSDRHSDAKKFKDLIEENTGKICEVQ